jgi:hypothetical protein
MPVSGSDWLRSAALVLVLLATLTTGCAGEDDGRAEGDARLACLLDAEARASAGVVARYLAEGKLGTRRQIEREIKALDSPGFEPVSFLTANSRMVPLDRMSADQRATFETWTATDRVQDVIDRAESRAIRLEQEKACTAD